MVNRENVYWKRDIAQERETEAKTVTENDDLDRIETSLSGQTNLVLLLIKDTASSSKPILPANLYSR